MSTARVVAVAPGSPADGGGVAVGDLLTAVNGQPIRDVIEYRVLTDDAEVSLSIDRGGLAIDIDIEKNDGEPLGIEVDSAVFDRVRTCDNHCEFCFIYQLPPGMRRSLYLKDDDYRLSFLYGNFTTLTRFTEADLDRPVGVRPPATADPQQQLVARDRRQDESLGLNSAWYADIDSVVRAPNE